MAVTEYENRRVRKKKPWKWIAAVGAAVCVIIFAFIWEATNHLDLPDDYGRDYDYGRDFLFPPNALSAVQKTIDKLDWITSAFLPLNEYSRPGDRLEEINAVVIHYIGNPGTTAKQNRNYFAGLAKSGEANLSSNFIVGLDGEILQCVPVDEIAYASNTRNIDTISIEMCHPDDTGRFNDATYDSAVRLTALLCYEFELTADDIIRHYDITGKECPRYFVTNEEAWEAFRADVADEIAAITEE